MIVRLDGTRLEPKGIGRRLLVKFVALIILFLLGAGLSFFVFSKYGMNDTVWKWSTQIGSSLFFASLISPILILPFISKRTQTITDYFSDTKILVDYEGIKKEERDYLNKIIENPTILIAGVSGASVISFGAVFVMMAIAFLFKVLGKRL